MSVDGVNNSNNTIAYAAGGAALAGGVGGGAYGYLSKPFLKDGAPTDTFIRKIVDNLQEEPLIKDFVAQVNAQAEQLKDVKSVDELKTFQLNQIKDVYGQFENLEEIKGALNMSCEMAENAGIKFIDRKAIDSVESLDDVMKLFADKFDAEYAGKTLDEIKAMSKLEAEAAAKKGMTNLFEQFWDSSKKVFVDCEEGIGAGIKKAADSVKLKTAGIYGAIGAAVLGLGTLAGCMLTGNKEAAEVSQDTKAKVNTEV